MQRLFEIIQSFLWGENVSSRQLCHTEYEALSQFAEKQTLLGILSNELIDKEFKLERMDIFSAYAQAGTIASDNEKVNSALEELCILLTRHHCQFLVVKGQTIDALYPKRGCRTPGDIDFIVPKVDFEQVRTFIADAWNVNFEIGDEESGHLSFEYHDVKFEMHFELIDFFSCRNQKYWQNLDLYSNKINVTIGEKKTLVPSLDPTLNILYTFLHLYQRHLIELGVGLRQFCDMAVLLHSYNMKIDRQQLNDHLHALDMHRAFVAVEAVLIDILGMPVDDCPIPINDKANRSVPIIMKVVLEGGNFGFSNRKSVARSGIGYYLESFMLKLRLYRMFYTLSPREIRAKMVLQLPRKIWESFNRVI